MLMGHWLFAIVDRTVAHLPRTKAEATETDMGQFYISFLMHKVTLIEDLNFTCAS